MADDIRHIVRTTPTEMKMDRLMTERRVLFILGPITPATASTLAFEILSSGFEKEKEKPVLVLIQSPGGDVLSGFAVYDLLKALAETGVPVHTVGLGLVASIAVPILQAGTKRFCLPNTQIIMHHASAGMEGEVNMMSDALQNSLRLNGRVLDIIQRRSGINRDKLVEDTKKKDFLLGADEALKYGPHGLIDEITLTLPF